MRRLLFLLVLLLSASPAAAQLTVVTACGTAPATLKAGQVVTGFMDINGNACTNASGGGGGGGGSVTQGTTPWVVSGAASAELAHESGGNLATLAGAVSASKFNVNISSGNPTTIQPTPATTGGMSVVSKQVANNTTSFAVDASAGTLYGVAAYNNSATIAYVKLYNTAQGSVTCGTPTPTDRMMIPANASGAGYIWESTLGVAYGTAITACVTTGFADNDTGAPAASTYIVDFYFK